MPGLKPGDDPYRILGVLRGADLDQIKAAHRRLAKRFHPDRAGGEEQRFLAVQEAYQLLSDPKRRHDWDRRHAPVPSWTPPSGTAPQRQGSPRAAKAARSPAKRRRGSSPDRTMQPPGQRTATWSAAHVPWWEDFRPRTPGANETGETNGAAAGMASRRGRSTNGAAGGTSSARGSGAARGATGATRGTPGPASADPSSAASEPFDLDAHSRSSGAAWSMAARRHFRRGDRDLPSRGSWRYRGSQVVTGAEARKAADEESARGQSPRGANPAGQHRDASDDEPAR